jgi:2-dehydro-3-deoxygluconokinase
MTTAALVTFGEAMGLVTAEETGPFHFARRFGMSVGGAEFNVAIGAARLGAPTAWFGRLGTDAVGDLIAYRLSAEGVRALVTRDASFTGLMVKYQRAAGRTHVDYHRKGSAGSRIAPADIPVAEVERAGVLHLTGITPALSESACETAFQAVAIARAAGVTVSFDVNYRNKLWDPDSAGPVLRRLVSAADIVFAGPEEAAMVLERDPTAPRHTLAEGLCDLGPSEAILKDGARGCSALIGGHPYDLPALLVREVDPVGAGDAIVAGYLAELLDGQSPTRRLATAIAAGAFAVTVPGDCEGLPTRAELAASFGGQDVLR